MTKHKDPVELREYELHSAHAGTAGASASGVKPVGQTRPANPIEAGRQPKRVIWDVLID